MLRIEALRASEAAALGIDRYPDTLRGHRILQLVGKGNKPASVPLVVPVVRVLEACRGELAFPPCRAHGRRLGVPAARSKQGRRRRFQGRRRSRTGKDRVDSPSVMPKTVIGTDVGERKKPRTPCRTVTTEDSFSPRSTRLRMSSSSWARWDPGQRVQPIALAAGERLLELERAQGVGPSGSGVAHQEPPGPPSEREASWSGK